MKRASMVMCLREKQVRKGKYVLMSTSALCTLAVQGWGGLRKRRHWHRLTKNRGERRGVPSGTSALVTLDIHACTWKFRCLGPPVLDSTSWIFMISPKQFNHRMSFHLFFSHVNVFYELCTSIALYLQSPGDVPSADISETAWKLEGPRSILKPGTQQHTCLPAPEYDLGYDSEDPKAASMKRRSKQVIKNVLK